MTETGRIRIYPASREQMERIIQAEEDDELKKAYGEMLEGCLTHPDQWDPGLLFIRSRANEFQEICR